MKSKTLMILGAGVYQIPAILEAKKLGHKTLVLSYNISDYPGSKIADIPLEVDTTNIPLVVKTAKKYKIDGVFTTGTDVALPALGKVNDELGLSGPSYKACLLATNKDLMKDVFVKNNIPTAIYQSTKDIEEAKKIALRIGYPVMVKAIRSSGSRGVKRARNEKELIKAWEFSLNYTRNNDPIVIEKFLKGKEFGAQGFIYNSKLVALYLHNDSTTSPPLSTPIGHSYPFSNPKIEKEVWKLASKTVKVLNLNNCAANFDFIATKEGPRVLEIGPRMGATCLPELTYIYTGINVTKECIKMALGEKPEFKEKINKQPTAGLLLRSPETGTIKSIKYPKSLKRDGDLVRLDFDVKSHDKVNKFKLGPDRIGEVVVKGKNWQQAENKVLEIEKKIKLTLINS